MSREDQFKARMQADAVLPMLLTGGIYTAGAVGRLGLVRATVAGGNNAIRPAALVRQRSGPNPDNVVRDGATVSVVELVEIYLYEDSLYTAIDAAILRLFGLVAAMEDAPLDDGAQVEITNVLNRARDAGAMANASLAVVTVAVYSVM